MAGVDPYTRLVEALVSALSGALGVDELEVFRLLSRPPREEYGDLGFPLLRYARRLGVDAGEVAGRVSEGLRAAGVGWAGVEVVGGFLNVRIDAGGLALELAKLYSAGWRPGVAPTPRPERVVVEHTSANPVHPLHMGHARNTALGDSLARLLSARGHVVSRRYYVDDVGLQMAYLALGVRLAGLEDLAGAAAGLGWKVDRLAGWVYSVTYNSVEAVVESRRVKAGEGDRSKLERLAGVLARLRESGPRDLFDRIFQGVEALEDPEGEVRRIAARYEAGEEPERSLLRSIAEAVLSGFRETLARLDVEFDAWDWESDLVWSGRVARIIEEARRSKYYTTYKGAEALDIPRIVRELVEPDPEARRAFRLPRGFEVPPLILVRSDGTTLYATRDIAYTLYKYEAHRADRVVNVVGADQRLEQLQVRLALLGLGYRREALNTLHYDYEIVRLPGMKMSGRRGEAVWLDDVLEEAKARAVEEVRARNPDAPREWVEETAEKVAVGAVRFALVQASASKPLVFDLDKVLDFKENSGPYLQYTHARAAGILAKHGPIDWGSIDPGACGSGQVRRLLVEASRFPVVAAKAADDLAPWDLASYLLDLADDFNSWYQKDTVIHEPDPGARNCKALLVLHVKETVAAGLGLLGVPAPERM